MTLNANAKAFVPGGGGGGGATTAATPGLSNLVASPIAPPQEQPLFRYSIVLPASRTADTESAPSSIPALSFLLSRRSLVSIAKGGPSAQAGRVFVQEFYSSLTLPLPASPSTPLSANGLYVPTSTGAGSNSNVGFFLSRDMLHHASEILVEANDRDGFLLPLLDIPPQANHHVVAPLILGAWELLFQLLYHDPRVSGMGYIMTEGPKGDSTSSSSFTTTYSHYFFVAIAAPKAIAGAAAPVPFNTDVFDQITRHSVVRVKHVLPYVLGFHMPLGAVVHFTDAPFERSITTTTTTAVANGATEENGAAPPAAATTAAAAKTITTFHVAFTPESASQSVAAVGQFHQNLTAYLTTYPRNGTDQTITDVVDVMIHVASPKAAAVPSTGSAKQIKPENELRMPTAMFLQSIETALRFVMGSILGCVVSPSFAESDVGATLYLDRVVDAAVLVDSIEDTAEARKAVLAFAHQKPPRSVLSTAAMSRSMTQPLDGIVSPVTSLSEWNAVLQELNDCFSSTTTTTTTTAASTSESATVPCSIAQCIANRELNAGNLLTRAAFATNIDKLVKEPLRARRRLLGVPVLIVVDSLSRISLVNLQTHEIVSLLHMDIWSCLHWALYPASCGTNNVPVSCVLEATLVSTYRGDRQYRLVVQDVFRWNAVNVSDRPLQQRMALVEPLEDETNWAHGSSHHIVILRAQYIQLQHAEVGLLPPGAMAAGSAASSLLAAPSSLASSAVIDYPCSGMEVVSTGPHTPQRFVWIPQSSVTVRFQSGMVETLENNVRRAHLMVRNDPIAAAAAGPTTAGVTSSSDAAPPPQPADANGVEEKAQENGEVGSGDGDGEEDAEAFDFYDGQYVDFHTSEVDGVVEPGWVLQCLLRRTPSTQEHYWELLTAHPGAPADGRDPVQATEVVSKKSYVDAILASPMISSDEWRWLLSASTFLCNKCNKVDDRGKNTGGPRTFMCRSCWAADGYGDCLYCTKTYVRGGKDTFTDRFYCEVCWGMFQTSRTFAAGAPPPSPDATFSGQVSTRVISLFIDAVCGGKGVSNDILELCAGASVVRKWASAQVQRYVAIENNRTAVEDLKQTIAAHKPAGSQFDVLCGDVFSPTTWQTLLPQCHPQQFHVVTCFHGLHHCFDTEAHARDVLFRISNALVPNGVFLAGAVSANALFQRGREVTTSVFQSSWGPDVGPRLGATYSLTVTGDETKIKHTVPLDVLVAVASDYNLQLVEEHCTTYADVLAKDAKWLRPTSQEEKDFLSTLLTVVFRKASNRESAVPTSP